jgi:hypothetical protein
MQAAMRLGFRGSSDAQDCDTGMVGALGSLAQRQRLAVVMQSFVMYENSIARNRSSAASTNPSEEGRMAESETKQRCSSE